MKKWETQIGTVEEISQHPPSNINELNSGFWHRTLRCFTQNKVNDAQQYFANGLAFKPTSSFPEVVNDMDVYLKPPSAGTQHWVVHNRHEIDNITQLFPRGMPTPLITLITPGDSSVVAVSAGDLVSVVLNCTYNPVGMMTSGKCGGQHTKEDLTYVIPMDKIIADIKEKCHWEAGSVSFCSG
ncbi:hypothetical protein IFR05_001759 [Cadophora sp. M221]|nr:hypothetical protein IFR05_001759 [Cadophora sp. M221]